MILCRHANITTCPVLAVTLQRRTGDIVARPSDKIISTTWWLYRGRATASRWWRQRGDAYESVRTATADNDCGDDGTATRETMTAAGGSWWTECRCRVVRLRSAAVGGGGDTVLLTPTTRTRAHRNTTRTGWTSRDGGGVRYLFHCTFVVGVTASLFVRDRGGSTTWVALRTEKIPFRWSACYNKILPPSNS